MSSLCLYMYVDASNGITADIESKEFHDDTSISLVVSLHLIIQVI